MGRPVFQYELSGKYVTRHESISDAARIMGCNESTIRTALNRENNKACGFRWYSKLGSEELKEEFKKARKEARKILEEKNKEVGNLVPNRYIEQPEIIENLIKYGTEYDPKDVNFGKVVWKEPRKIGKLEKLDHDGNVINNTLIIGDLHAPFTRAGYLDFCKEIRDKYFCNNIIFIGDLVDNHFSSFHDTDPDGHGAAEELRLAKLQLQEWYKAFPVAKVCIGNHDLIPIRKSFNAGLSKMWIKSISEVLNTPNWEYEEEFLIDDVLYVHGTGRKAINRMQADLISVVQGHYHSESYIQYAVGKFKKMFAMQLGCGVDDKSYAMAYGKHFDKMHINCGVVLDGGNLPILEYMKL